MEFHKFDLVYDTSTFDCGDTDLNDFLKNDAMDYQNKSIANTYVVIEQQNIVAYFSLLNDKISKTDVSKSAWRKLKKLFAHSKHRSNYPAIKIGRFAVDKKYSGIGFGSEILETIKYTCKFQSKISAFRFLTVDAYINAVPFYARNGFIEMLSEQDGSPTRIMYFDMLNFGN